MSRLESEEIRRFEIAKDENPSHQGLLAVPLNLRRQAVEQFDREFRLDEIRARDHRFNLERQIDPALAEGLANARLLFQEGEFQLAQDIYGSALKIDPQNEMAIRGSAECASAQGLHEKAVQILEKLVAKHKTSQNLLLLADELYLLGYNEDALTNYLLALRNSNVPDEELFQIYKNMGNIYLRVGDVNAAEEQYNKAYTIHPDSDVLLVNFGSLAVYSGDYEKALARFREAVKINDRNDKAWVGLAMIHREYGDVELGWANVEKSLDVNPQNESAIRLVCEWAMKDNEIEKGLFRVGAYLEKSGNDAQVLMWHAKFLYFNSQVELALHQIEKALRLEPDLEGGVEVQSVIRAELSAREAANK